MLDIVKPCRNKPYYRGGGGGARHEEEEKIDFGCAAHLDQLHDYNRPLLSRQSVTCVRISHLLKDESYKHIMGLFGRGRGCRNSL